MIKIFHTADLHLDSPFSSLPPSLSEQRRGELRQIYLDMMKYAAEQKADLVLIPGDLFDSSYVTRDTADLLYQGFSQVGCPVVICPGNHDPFTPDSIYAREKMPDNVYIFNDESPTCFNFPQLNVSVWGAAFVRPLMENTPLGRIPRLNPNLINILCQHGDTRNLLSKKCPLNLRDIAYRGFTYAALGHVHMPDEPAVIDNTTVAYSGCPIGRSFDEPGWGGALMVIIGDDRTVSCQKIRFAAKRYMVEKLDVGGISDYSEAASRLEALIRDRQYGKETSLRVIFEGEIAPSVNLPMTTLTRKCQEPLAHLELQNRMLPIFDTAYLENDMTLRGAFYRELLPLLSQGSERERAVAAEALRAGLAAIDGRTIFSDTAPETDAEEDRQ